MRLASAIVDFYRIHGIDRTPRERQLFLFVRRGLGPKVNTYNISLILRRLVGAGVLVRETMIGRAIEYRLRRTYAFPLWPGYARDAEELLTNAWTHVWADGTFSVLGTSSGKPAKVDLVAADHFFAEFLAYRGSLQARLRGLEPQVGDHDRLVEAALREAPVLAIRDIGAHGDFPKALRILQGSVYRRALAGDPYAARSSMHGEDALRGEDGRHCEAAIELLHVMCGHKHLVRRAFEAEVGDIPPSVGFEALDHAVGTAIDQRIRALGRAEQEALAGNARLRFSRPQTPRTVDDWAMASPIPLTQLATQAPCTALTAARARKPIGDEPVPAAPAASSEAWNLVITRNETGVFA